MNNISILLILFGAFERKHSCLQKCSKVLQMFWFLIKPSNSFSFISFLSQTTEYYFNTSQRRQSTLTTSRIIYKCLIMTQLVKRVKICKYLQSSTNSTRHHLQLDHFPAVCERFSRFVRWLKSIVWVTQIPQNLSCVDNKLTFDETAKSIAPLDAVRSDFLCRNKIHLLEVASFRVWILFALTAKRQVWVSRIVWEITWDIT